LQVRRGAPTPEHRPIRADQTPIPAQSLHTLIVLSNSGMALSRYVFRAGTPMCVLPRCGRGPNAPPAGALTARPRRGPGRGMSGSSSSGSGGGLSRPAGAARTARANASFGLSSGIGFLAHRYPHALAHRSPRYLYQRDNEIIVCNMDRFVWIAGIKHKNFSCRPAPGAAASARPVRKTAGRTPSFACRRPRFGRSD